MSMTSRRYSQITAVFMTLALSPLVTLAQTSDSDTEAKEPMNTRAVSRGVAAALAASMPKYDPPKPVEKKDGEEEAVDLREVDKPKNKIVRLPEYVVREKKPEIFRERDIYTDKGLRELAKLRYLSETGQALNSFNLPLFGSGADAYAMLRYEEEERLKNISDLNESARDASLTDPENAKALREATRDTYSRGFDYTYRNKN